MCQTGMINANIALFVQFRVYEQAREGSFVEM